MATWRDLFERRKMGKITVLVSRMKMVGYRTYGVVGLVLIAGVLEGLGLFTMPVWAWKLLGAGGLGFLRVAVSNISKPIAEIVKEKP